MGLLVERGVFESEESLTTSAYRSLLTLQPELKLEIAWSLYQREEIALVKRRRWQAFRVSR